MYEYMYGVNDRRGYLNRLCGSLQASGTQLGLVMQIFSSLVLAIAVSFYFSWQITLIMAMNVPFLVTCSALVSSQMTDNDAGEKVSLEAASKVRDVMILKIQSYVYHSRYIVVVKATNYRYQQRRSTACERWRH